ncbi:MAG: histidine kinase, partial [Gammaproteobacteria bacterium]|nr:histidine kinase [Gammaproteobacteria bacterium]
LDSPQLRAVLSTRDSNASLNQHHRALVVLWEHTLKPLAQTADPTHYGERVDAFVEALDGFVLALQRDSENKQQIQQAIQGIAMFITVIILIVGMHDLINNVVGPLKELMRSTERYRDGDLEARAQRTTDDELGELVNSFNEMADTVASTQRSLQALLGEKSALLAQSRAALQLLHHSTHTVAYGAARADNLNRLVQDFRQTLSGLDVRLCLDGLHSQTGHKLVFEGGPNLDVCTQTDCNQCTRITPQRRREYPILSQGRQLGRLYVTFSENRPADVWEEDLIRTLADLIGTALTLQQRREQDRLLVLQEERAVIARELHDSLAQSLSYIKLQISRLQRLVERGTPTDELIPVTEDIREGVNSAYRQLRELLTTFRLKMTGSDLPSALKETLTEFSSRGNLDIRLAFSPLPCPLSASEEIHILQIVREA